MFAVTRSQVEVRQKPDRSQVKDACGASWSNRAWNESSTGE